MAADIMILSITPAEAGFVNLNVLFWIVIANPYPVPGAQSAYPAVGTDPNTTTVVAALQNGTLIEEQHSFSFPLNWITTQWAAIEALLVAYLVAKKAVRTGTLAALPDPGLKYKVFHDSGTGWSV